MAYDGWVRFGGTDLFNMARTSKLSELMGIDSVWVNSEEVEWIQEALGEFDYDDVTKAPWYDEGFPASEEFAGILPLTLSGLDDSSRTSTPIEYITDGGSPGHARNATLPLVANVAIVASTERGAEFGLRWMNRLLRSRGEGATCSGTTLEYFRYADSNSPVAHRRNVRLTRGTSVTRKRRGPCSSIWLVTFTLVAADPYEYGAERTIVRMASFPNLAEGVEWLNQSGNATTFSFDDGPEGNGPFSWNSRGTSAGNQQGFGCIIPATPGRFAVRFGGIDVSSLPNTGILHIVVTFYDVMSAMVGAPVFSIPITLGEHDASSIECNVQADMPETAYYLGASLIYNGDNTITNVTFLVEEARIEALPAIPDPQPGAIINLATAPTLGYRALGEYHVGDGNQDGSGWVEHVAGAVGAVHWAVTDDWAASQGGRSRFNSITAGASILPGTIYTGFIGSYILPYGQPGYMCEPGDEFDISVVLNVLSAGPVGDPGCWIECIYYHYDGDPTHTTLVLHENSGSLLTAEGVALGRRTFTMSSQCPVDSVPRADNPAVMVQATMAQVVVIEATSVPGQYLAHYTDRVLVIKNQGLVPWFDGDSPNAGWQGVPGYSTSALPAADAAMPGVVFGPGVSGESGSLVLTEYDCPVYDYSPVYDPQYPALVPSPTSPDFLPEGWAIVQGATFDRSWARINPVEPSTLNVVPIISLSAADPVRYVRVSVWPFESAEDDQCDPLFSVVVSYLPSDSVFVIDGEKKAAYIWDNTAAVRRTDSLVFSDSAGPLDWTAFNDNNGLLITMDVFSDSDELDNSGSVQMAFSLMEKSD